MAETYTETTTKSWWSNITGSFAGMLVGIVVFLASFYVLWTNEGRLNMATVAEKSVAISASQADPSANNKLVSVTEKLFTDDLIGDSGLLRSGSYLELERKVEMFAWEEDKKSETKDNTGGSSTTTTTYSYKKGWTDRPEESSRFKYPAGHQNPQLPFKSETVKARSAMIGIYRVNPARLHLPNGQPLALTGENAIIYGGNRLDNGFLYRGYGSMSYPEIGDVRISYTAVPNDITVTLFGKLEGTNIVPYVHKGKDTLFRAFDSSRDEAIAKMGSEYRTWLWIVRVIGFLMMWFGLFSLFGPVKEVLDVLPFLGKVGQGLAGAVTFVIALILSVVTVVISMVAHNIWLLVGIIVIVFGFIFYKRMMPKKVL